MDALRFIARWWPAFALVAALSMLGGAHAFEHFGGYPPCPLCLKQRDVYWMAVAVALPATVWAVFARSKGAPRVASYLLFAIFLTGAIVATFHAGGELKWWSLPATCGGSADSVSFDDMAAMLGGAKVRAPACDVAAWSMWGVSMAGWNAIISAVLALISLISSMRRKTARNYTENGR